ncbi:MAG TPA: hypothetical protein VG536_19295 [Pseudomonas sp.]|nr:hypothetical protein [Pseudomonas sp.]
MRTLLKLLITPAIFSVSWLCLIILAANTPPNQDDLIDKEGLPMILLHALGVLCIGAIAIILNLIGNIATAKFSPSNRLFRICISLIANIPLLLTALFAALATYTYVHVSALSIITMALFLASAIASIVTTKWATTCFSRPK